MNEVIKKRIALEVTKEIYRDFPDLWAKFGENGRFRTEEDNMHHLNHLETTMKMNDESYFLDYTEWLNRVLTSRNVGTHLIIDNFERLILHLRHYGSEEEQKAYTGYLKSAIQQLQD
ncbi:hypothetical protein DH09_19240 [Bacillaceae bacterium JMAK1]|nr:hypothetical protein DH09_19240 [Bacillaceae bacterium JMAK1]